MSITFIVLVKGYISKQMSAKTMIEALTDHKKLWKMKGETKLFDENREFWFEWEESDRICLEKLQFDVRRVIQSFKMT